MTPAQFVARWQTADLSERAGYQIHFNDLCELFAFPKPGDMGADDSTYCFEKRAARVGKSAKGWADVWKRDAFAWEYKGAHKDLEAAYDQLLRYHDDLGSPPVLVVCDLHSIIVRIKRTNRALVKRIIPLESLGAFQSPNLAYLRRAFHEPDALESGELVEQITQGVASTLGEVADTLQKRYTGQDERVARFLDRIVFGFFAEDAGLLPRGVLERIFSLGATDASRVSRQLAALFEAMRVGGDFGTDQIRHFNGNLFDALDEPLALTAPECAILLLAARKNWAEIDPSIFGTLFERSLDTRKRAQLGAHYTSRADIETLIKPVILEPLHREWEAVQEALEALPRLEEDGSPATPRQSGTAVLFQSPEIQPQSTEEAPALAILEAWLARLEGIRVLDPACGSGAFLYVALEGLLDLEKRARIWAEDAYGAPLAGRIRPEHLLGLELNAYAHDLAQITVWIGFLQWQRANGYPFPADPILRHTDNIAQCDALLDDSQGLAAARERPWPDAEFIVGNPPFLGGSRLWRELGRDTQAAMWRVYDGRVPGGADLCCYWFEKARAQIASGAAKRAGLVATQAIRGGANREVLGRIKASGDIFFAVSDRNWELEGANVHVSLVGFDDGSQSARELDTLPVASINANLTGSVDVTRAKPLAENAGISIIGTKKAGTFNLTEEKSLSLLKQPNPHGLPNSDVLRPWANGMSLVQRTTAQWIIDPGVNMTREDFELYEKPYSIVNALVRPEREKSNEKPIRENWWRHARPRPEFREATKNLTRYLATPRVSKHRIFVWLSPEVLPDDGIFTFARSDDYFFGILHSRVHELWARATGTQLREVESGFRYTPTTCFDPFPFPDASQNGFEAQHAAISAAAATLHERREGWLNPPEWMREEILEFRASQSGPWGARVENPDARGVGTVRYVRQVLKPELGIGALFKREKTLTNLYNTRPAWLASAHANLDAAVLEAYGLQPDVQDESVMGHLLELNLSRGLAS